jgi:hypothetical protein
VPIIDIIRRPDGKVAFKPTLSDHTQLGDRFKWRNKDEQASHWVTLKGKPKDFWFQFPLAPFTLGQTADTTPDIVPQDTTPIVFVCFDEDVEGQITF